MKITEREMMHALSIIKLLYILIILSALYTLKIFLHPEGAYELLVAPHQMGFYLENIFWSFMIIIGGSVLVKRVI
jgi:hypothetical protein